MVKLNLKIIYQTMSKSIKTGFVIVFFSMFFLLLTTSPLIAVASSGIVVETQPTVAEELVNKIESSWPWYISRASGLVAALVLIVLLLSGIGFITGTTYKFLEPITAWATHRALGIILTVALVLHVGALYFDSFAPFNFSDLLIPFKSNYRPVSIFGFSVGSLYVALGVIALYLIGLIVATSLLWMEKLPKTWKAVHILSYLVMFFVFIHALFLGTDLAAGVLRWLWILFGVVLLLAALVRLWRAKTL